jgi:hypothetical protein
LYSTCIFCHGSLGKNEAIEHFPVGRRLAFDAGKGRLWAVCRSCERWNLSPIDERWEAIEECERLFRDTKLRVSTDNIGLARLKEGTTLVRVGDPQRPEMAAWRYGDQFHRRRRKHVAMVAGGVAIIGGVVIAGPMMGLVGGVGVNLVNVPGFLNNVLSRRTLATVPVNGSLLRLNRLMIDKVSLYPSHDGGFMLSIQYKRTARAYFTDRHGTNHVELVGDEALRAARHLLPHINRAGARPAQVREAVNVLEDSSDTQHLFSSAAISWRATPGPRERFAKWSKQSASTAGHISTLPLPLRLALEMSLHEQDERRALEGELSQLEDRWREAEEVAAIADDMFVPSGVSTMLKRLKGDRG